MGTEKRKHLLGRLLKFLYEKYPDYTEEKDLSEFKDVLPEALGITAPIPAYTKKVHSIDYLAKIAQIRQTNLIELLCAVPNTKIPNRYRITIRGIELISQMELKESSNHLEKLTHALLLLTFLLAIFTFRNFYD